MSEQKVILDLDDVDITSIMEQIHANLAERGYDVDEVNRLAAGISLNDGSGDIAQVIATSNVAFWWQIPAGIGAKGKLRVFINKVMRKLTFFYMKHVFDQQNGFNRSATAMLGVMSDKIAALEEANGELSSQICEMEKAQRKLVANMEKHELVVDETMEKYMLQIASIESVYAQRQNQLDALYTAAASRLHRIENNVAITDTAVAAKTSAPSGEETPQYIHSFDYFLFESKHRGSAAEIRSRQERYLPYFNGQENVVDLGCGRGEFLQLLGENDIAAVGVDILPENIACCAQLGVDARLGDCIAYLAGCEDDSLGGIFSAQVIEHLTNEQLIELVRLAHLKLKTGAKLVMETLNPQCLMIYAECFYLDPSHTKPVHPYMVEFVAQCEGFTDCEFIFMSPSNDDIKFPLDSSNKSSHLALATTNNLLYGNREYAIIATK